MLVNGTNPLRQRENLSPGLLCHPDDGTLELETESATIGRRRTSLSGASEASRCRAVPSLSLTGEGYDDKEKFQPRTRLRPGLRLYRYGVMAMAFRLSALYHALGLGP